MKYRAVITVILAVAIVSVTACEKEKENTVLDTMLGGVRIPFPTYVTPGFEARFNIDTLTTITLLEGATQSIGYYVTDPNSTTKKDTLIRRDGTVLKKEFTIKSPDKTGDYSVQIVAFAEGYYATSETKHFSVVREGLNGDASLTDFDITPSDQVFTDSRDGLKYYYTSIGGVDWMRQNLAWAGAGKALEDAEPSSAVFGRFYTHTEALTACPDGWNLPSESDWIAMAEQLGKTASAGEIITGLAGSLMENVKFNGNVLWEYWPQVKINNFARFSALPFGYASIVKGKYRFRCFRDYSMFWSSDITEDGLAANRYIYVDKPDIYYGELPADDNALNVRCIRK